MKPLPAPSTDPAAADLAAVARENGFTQCVMALRRTLATAPVGWLLVAWLCWERVPHGVIGSWVLGFLGAWAIGLWVLTRVIHAGPQLARHGRHVLAVAMLDGLAWGSVVWLLMGHDPVLDAWLAAVLSGVGAVNAPVYITYVRAYRVQIGTVWASALVASLVHFERPHVLDPIIGLTVFFALIGYYMHPIARRVLEGLRLQLMNASLAEQLQQALQAVEQDAATDALTGQGNRRALDATLQQQLALAQRSGRPFSLLLLDIDHFKQVNDQHGHGVGDAALQAFAERARGALREGDVFARYGGEEFVVVLPGTALPVALEIAERVRSSVAASALLSAPPLRVTVSIGAAQHRPGQSVAQLLARADAAVYVAKRGGRNRVCEAEPLLAA